MTKTKTVSEFVSSDDFLDEPFEMDIEPLSEGTVIADQFRLIRHIGSGGSGDVYEAEDASLGGAPVALKILSPLAAASSRVSPNGSVKAGFTKTPLFLVASR